MTRLVASCALLLLVVTSAPAARQQPAGPASLKRDLWSSTFSPDLASQLAAKPAATASADEEMVITDDTQVHFNGKPCRYRDVPADATIESIRLGPDNKTIQSIRFKSNR